MCAPLHTKSILLESDGSQLACGGRQKSKNMGSESRYQAWKNSWMRLGVKLQLQQSHTWVKSVVNWARKLLLKLLSRKKRMKKKKRTLTLTSSENISRLLQALPLGRRRKRLSGHRVGVVEPCGSKRQKHQRLMSLLLLHQWLSHQSVRLQGNSYRLQVISSLSILALIYVANFKFLSADEEDDQAWDDLFISLAKM